MRLTILTLMVFLCNTIAPAFAQENVAATSEIDDEIHLQFESSPASESEPVPPTRLYPIGEMIVNRETQAGLLVVCAGLNDLGHCDRFRFVSFPDAGNLTNSAWASPSFRIAARFAGASPEKQQQALRKWIRKKLSSPRLTTTQRIFIGMGTVFGIMITGAVLSMQAGSSEEASQIFDRTRNILIVAIPLAGYMDVLSPIFTSSATALIGAKTENLGEMKENFLLRQTRVRDRIFSRITKRIAEPATYQTTRWVTLSPATSN